jgi:hypothetical protein
MCAQVCGVFLFQKYNSEITHVWPALDEFRRLKIEQSNVIDNIQIRAHLEYLGNEIVS